MCSDDDTVIDSPGDTAGEPIVAESFDEQDVEIAAVTHVGRVRTSNEDQYCVLRRTRTGEVLSSSLPEDQLPGGEQRSWLLTVADGLGGHVAGEVASATAIRTSLDFANQFSSWIMRPVDGLREDFDRRVELYMKAIQEAMQQQVASDPGLAGMATTITSAYLYGGNACIVNLGDSRSYLIRSNKIQQITRDHTLAQDMADMGMSPESTHPYRNVLTHTMSTGKKPVYFDMFHLQLQSEDRILLCSDGLSDMVPDKAILEIITCESTAKAACEKLTQLALANGGRDNITIVLARLL